MYGAKESASFKYNSYWRSQVCLLHQMRFVISRLYWHISRIKSSVTVKSLDWDALVSRPVRVPTILCLFAPLRFRCAQSRG